MNLVCPDYVRRGVAHLGHGKRRGPVPDGEALRVAAGGIRQTHEGDLHPWRRRVDHQRVT